MNLGTLNEISKLKAEQIFVEAKINDIKKIIERNINYYDKEEYSADKLKITKELEKLLFRLEEITCKIWALESKIYNFR